MAGASLAWSPVESELEEAGELVVALPSSMLLENDCLEANVDAVRYAPVCQPLLSYG
jgi:hypothetical protein